MAKATPEQQVALNQVKAVYAKEVHARLTGREELERQLAEKMAELEAATNASIADALRVGALPSHIHNFSLGTKSNKRVYEVKNRMAFEPEPEETLESVTVKHYGWTEEPEVAWFETSSGMIERVQIPMDYQNEPLVAQTGEESALIAANRDLFVAALTKFYGK